VEGTSHSRHTFSGRHRRPTSIRRVSEPLRVAVVGSGPAGFYAAAALLDADEGIEVDMIERLPTPWGLVRLGVAPDHPKLKSVSKAFERIALKPGFRFLGNVEVGRQLLHEDLLRLYDGVLYAVGAQTDRRLGIPGEDLQGSWSATEFVAWYNGHPDFQDLEFDLNVERAVVIGNGNVALDVARMLALTPEELAPTDTTDPAMEAIGESAIREILVVGRRGPAQASWTTQELKEMGDLAGADIAVDPADLDLDPASAASLEHDTNSRRNLEVLREFAERGPTGKPVTLRLRFLLSPVSIHGDGKVEAIELVRNRLEERDGGLVAVPTDERETIDCQLVFRSVGYLGVALPDLPFEERRGTIRNDRGRRRGAAGGARRSCRPVRRLDVDRRARARRGRDARAAAREVLRLGRAPGRCGASRRVCRGLRRRHSLWGVEAARGCRCSDHGRRVSRLWTNPARVAFRARALRVSSLRLPRLGSDRVVERAGPPPAA
jgi:ferredoxin--NADP+ reductase